MTEYPCLGSDQPHLTAPTPNPLKPVPPSAITIGYRRSGQLGLFTRFRRRKALPPSPPPPAQPWPPESVAAFPSYHQFDLEPELERPAWLKYPVTPPKGHIIVFANEKGGVGKSTSAFHTCIALCNAGERVAALDVDLRQ